MFNCPEETPSKSDYVQILPAPHVEQSVHDTLISPPLHHDCPFTTLPTNKTSIVPDGHTSVLHVVIEFSEHIFNKASHLLKHNSSVLLLHLDRMF